MNKEIKEILEFLQPIENRHCATLGNTNCKLLLDYITNLQQENERLKEANKILEENWEQYMMICGKAIEYINKEFKDEPYSVFIYGKTNIDNLLNILQNGSDDNE